MRILSMTIQNEPDVVLTRQRAREIAGLLGFSIQEQTHIATAVSEIARNAFMYAGGGKVEFLLEGETVPQIMLISISDRGPGIPALQAIFAGAYQSKTGMGFGITGARRLMDQLEIETKPGQGTTVHLKKLVSRQTPLMTAERVTQIAGELAQRHSSDPFAEIQQQNQELLRILEELRARQEDLLRLNRELEDTNRGVMALYAELDEKADHLRRADELKTRFLSNMSHEFRTPVNSILALSRLLLDRNDGDLTPEQEKQATFIRKAADTLSDLINDLLDIAKIEAGKVTIWPTDFAVSELFSTLRGMLRPLLLNNAVNLVFEEPENIPTLYTDDSKVSQILRNFLSNALKFTELGEVRVSASLMANGEAVVFSVADTGIGIAPEDQETIFHEFTQLEHPLQKRVKGTGLGLPLCKKLAELLGGSVSVQSTLGVGSTFSTTIPLHYQTPPSYIDAVETQWELDPTRLPVLIIEDKVQEQFIYEKFLKGSRFQAIPAYSLREAQQVMLRVRPCAIVLDILLSGRDSWIFLSQIKADETTKDIPILVVTTVVDQRKGLVLGADAYAVKPVGRAWLLEELTRLTGQPQLPLVLIVDDEEISRYVLKQFIIGTSCVISEAETGLEGLRRAREEQPQIIFLDLSMPGLDGYQFLQQLKADPATKDIPVVVSTAKVLNEEEWTQLSATTAAVLPKATLSRETVTKTIKSIFAEGSQSRI
jgi:signal transduction histidine kinase/CheY-like chemotaxis protein